MEKQEILLTPFGEFMDLISCLSIYNGNAKPKKQRRKLSYQEIMALN